MLPQKIRKSADSGFNVQLCSLKRAEVLQKGRKMKIYCCLEVKKVTVCCQTMQRHVERTDGNPRS